LRDFGNSLRVGKDLIIFLNIKAKYSKNSLGKYERTGAAPFTQRAALRN
jgi:hypothetical protein